MKKRTLGIFVLSTLLVFSGCGTNETKHGNSSNGDNSSEVSFSDAVAVISLDDINLEVADKKVAANLICKAGESVNPLDLISISDGLGVWENNGENKNVRFSVTSNVENISLDKPGNTEVIYTVTYGSEDKIRYQEDFVKNYSVFDKTAPIIKFANNKIILDYGVQFDPLKNIKSVTDNVDGEALYVDINSIPDNPDDLQYFWYTLENTVKTDTPGTYNVRVLAVDTSGNSTEGQYSVIINEKPIVRQSTPPPNTAPVAPQITYVLNTNTYKFHYPSCASVQQMKPKNRWDYTGTRDEIIKMGYVPCKKCNP